MEGLQTCHFEHNILKFKYYEKIRPCGCRNALRVIFLF